VTPISPTAYPALTPATDAGRPGLGYARAVALAPPPRLRRALAAHPDRADALLAAAFALPSVVQAIAVPFAPRLVGLIVALGTTVPIAWRRSHPVAAALAMTLFWLVPTEGYPYLGYVIAFVIFYSLAAHVADGRRVAGVVALGVVVTIVGTAMHDAAFGEFFGAISSVAAPAVVGRVVRRQRDQAARLQELAGHLERERERGARAAVAEERARIARELHDVVAHGVSVIAIQSDAAEAALDRDPALAQAPLRTIRGSATEALAEMRRLLDVLREDDAGGELAPQPGLGRLPELVERARAAGVDVTLEVSGTPQALPPSVDLSAYRIVQEALTNVRKHAGGAPTTVALAWRRDALEVEVRDAGPGPRDGGVGEGGGHGLIGMRERVRLHGGELRTGAAPGGGFAVSARLPLDDPA
jgi:signal transduction histidine kinase